MNGSRALGIDLVRETGATESASIQRLVLCVPSRDRNGIGVESSPWVEEALQLLSRIGGGATAMPPADGAWWNEETNRLIGEKVVLVYCYIDPEPFEQGLAALREFLHRMGRETNQGEVVFEFADRLYHIDTFDGPAKRGKTR